MLRLPTTILWIHSRLRFASELNITLRWGRSQSVQKTLTTKITRKRQQSGSPATPAPTLWTPPDDVLHELVQVFFNNYSTRISSVPENLIDENGLKLFNYFKRIMTLNVDFAEWLVIPLIEGLIMGGEAINFQVPINNAGDKTNILSMVCQWQFFSRQCGWGGKNEIVKMVLSTPGIRVNDTMPNGTNAAFLAVKCGDIDTLKILIEAGIDLTVKDYRGYSILHNTLEYPDPEKLRLILQYVSAKETYVTFVARDDESLVEHEVRQSAADLLLSLYDAQMNTVCGNDRVDGPISWSLLGKPPPMEHIAECLIIVRQNGSSFTPERKDSWLTLRLAFLGLNNANRAPKQFKKVGKCLMGLWLPQSIQEEVKAHHELNTAQEEQMSCIPDTCSICLEDFTKPTKLYCGHWFCRKCIIEKGRHLKNCPLCTQRLCLDVAPNRDDIGDCFVHTATSRNGNIDGNYWNRRDALLRNIDNLTADQVIEEAKCNGLINDNSRNHVSNLELKQAILRGYNSAVQQTSGSFEGRSFDTGETNSFANGHIVVETAVTHNLFTGELLLVAPNEGPVWIDIKVKGVPVIACISNNSRYTTISSKFVETFGLKRIDNLTTTEMRCGLTGSKLNKVTCLKDFKISIGEEVTCSIPLINAMEVHSSNESEVGIRLGQDFLLSGLYCALTVNIAPDQGMSMLVDGMHSYPLSSSAPSKESLRYYSHDGKIAKLPLIHFNPHKNATCSVVSLKPDATFVECGYCSRTFPQSVSKCTCGMHYCDQECLNASWKVHKVTRHVGCLD